MHESKDRSLRHIKMAAHFPHGAGVYCLVCFLQRVNMPMLESARADIIREQATYEAGTDDALTLLVDKRVLRDAEILLLLCAEEFATSTVHRCNAASIYEIYYVISRRLIPAMDFKRFRNSSSYSALRRRLVEFRKKYGQTASKLHAVSRYPEHCVIQHASLLLASLERFQADVNTPIIAKLLAGRSRSNPTTGSAVEQPNVPEEVFRDALADQRASARVTIVDVSGTGGFQFYHQQQFLDVQDDLSAAYADAFGRIIPLLLRTARGEFHENDGDRDALLATLKSLFFLSFARKNMLEAAEIGKALLVLLDKSDQDYRKFQMYAEYASGSMRLEHTSDLYCMFIDHLPLPEKQVYVSLKLETLLNCGRFGLAVYAAKSIVCPKLSDGVDVWNRVLQSSLILPVIYSRKEAVQKLLAVQIEHLQGKPGYTAQQHGVLSELSAMVQRILTLVAALYPIHLTFMKQTGLLFLVIVLVFENDVKFEETRLAFGSLGLHIQREETLQDIQQIAKYALEVGNFKLANRFYLLLDSHNLAEEDAFEVLLALAQIELISDRAVEAQTHLIQSVESAEKHRGRQNSYALCLVFMAHGLSLQGALLSASRLYEEARWIFHSNRNYGNYAFCLFGLATLCWKMEAWETSIELLNEAQNVLSCAQSSSGCQEKRSLVVAIYVGLAASFFHSGNEVKADEFIAKQSDWAQRLKMHESELWLRYLFQCRTWKSWVGIISRVAPDVLTTISFLLYPTPQTGTAKNIAVTPSVDNSNDSDPTLFAGVTAKYSEAAYPQRGGSSG